MDERYLPSTSSSFPELASTVSGDLEGGIWNDGFSRSREYISSEVEGEFSDNQTCFEVESERVEVRSISVERRRYNVGAQRNHNKTQHEDTASKHTGDEDKDRTSVGKSSPSTSTNDLRGDEEISRDNFHGAAGEASKRYEEDIHGDGRDRCGRQRHASETSDRRRPKLADLDRFYSVDDDEQSVFSEGEYFETPHHQTLHHPAQPKRRFYRRPTPRRIRRQDDEDDVLRHRRFDSAYEDEHEKRHRNRYGEYLTDDCPPSARNAKGVHVHDARHKSSTPDFRQRARHSRRVSETDESNASEHDGYAMSDSDTGRGFYHPRYRPFSPKRQAGQKMYRKRAKSPVHRTIDGKGSYVDYDRDSGVCSIENLQSSAAFRGRDKRAGSSSTSERYGDISETVENSEEMEDGCIEKNGSGTEVNVVDRGELEIDHQEGKKTEIETRGDVVGADGGVGGGGTGGGGNRPHGGLSVLDLIMGMGQRRAAAIDSGEGGPWQKVRQLVRGIAYAKNSMLIHTQRQLLKEKDFNREIQALQDIRNFITAKAVFLSDLPNNSFHDVLEPMLEELLKDEPKTSMDEALQSVFTEPSHSTISNSIQSAVKMGGSFFFEESWVCVFSSLQTLQSRHVAIGRLKQPGNLGMSCSDIHFVVMVLAPAYEKGTKNAMQTALTFATVFTDLNFRSEIMNINDPKKLKKAIHRRTDQLSDMTYIPNLLRRRASMEHAHNPFTQANVQGKGWGIARGIRADIKRRLASYVSDFTDGVTGGSNTILRVLMTISFLYFSSFLFTVALGVLNDKNSHGYIGVRKAIVGLTIAGLVNGFCGGQHLVVLLTSAPLALYAKLVYTVSEDMGAHFLAVYATVGMSCSIFLAIYAILDLSKFMKWSTRCVDEVFSIFVACSFLKDAFTDLMDNFQTNYLCVWDQTTLPKHDSSGSLPYSTMATSLITMATAASNITPAVLANGPTGSSKVTEGNFSEWTGGEGYHGDESKAGCYPENSLLFLILMIGVPLLGIVLTGVRKSAYLARTYREILSDQAIGITVLFWSYVGSYCFRAIKLKPWNYDSDQTLFSLPDFSTMSVGAWIFSAFIGFCLSLLIFMDHNIAESLVNSPSNKLKKGTAYHWDLFMIATLNFNFALFGLPMVHGKVPHSPMHVRSLSEVEERLDQGYLETVTIYVHETRLTTIIAHALMGVSILMLPLPMQYIPKAVLDGIYIFVSLRSLIGNQFFERLLLIITEQSAYPPNSYVRRVPQKKMHIFTVIEIMELIVMCYLGLNSITYMKMVFPVIVILLIPVRHLLMPKIIARKYLDALDKH
ncbi:solute carrier family 4 member 11-like [Ptychodera flava]|uniref:solute carrier family 4 member 11-like n=1 Tax=Ptychodera flava TaxID=63121 RepID=UPI00396A78C9